MSCMHRLYGAGGGWHLLRGVRKSVMFSNVPLTKNSAEILREYLKEETSQKSASEDKLTRNFPDLSLE